MNTSNTTKPTTPYEIYRIRLHNRRVYVGRLDDKWFLELKWLKDGKPKSVELLLRDDELRAVTAMVGRIDFDAARGEGRP